MRKSVKFWICFAVAVAGAIYFTTRIVMIAGGRGDLARVRTISISADHTPHDLSPIAAATGVAPGTSGFRADLDAINARIAAVPGVKHSAVRRRADGNLTVRVALHRAIAQWTDGDRYFPLSADGTIIRSPATTRTPGAVLMRGDVPGNLTEIVRVAAAMGDALDWMEWIENRRWNLHTTGGITVMLPQTDPAAAISTLMILDKNNAILSRDLRVIDMRDTARILVR